MLKENGRVTPMSPKELANLSDKKYKCPKCSYVMILSESEFGKKYGCPNCDGLMEEDTFK
jgi:ssDNA-binding Zn-finger/Zn-ribbon topoisomerase 1